MALNAKPKMRTATERTARISATSNKLAYVLMGLLIVYSVVKGLIAASTKPLWYDEILTWAVSSQSGWNHIVTALLQGTDGQPPLFHLIEHCALQIPVKKEIALRLPSILVFPCTLACVFIYAKRRAGEVIALTCAIFLLATATFQFYATEARPYSMVVACFAFALVCYQRISIRYWAIAMGVALALAESLHYYAMLSVVPFGIAEIVYIWLERKIRWPTWGALACSFVPLLLNWRILANFREIYGAHFWSRYTLGSVPETYDAFVLKNTSIGFVVALICAAIVVRVLFFSVRADSSKENATKDLVEGTLLIGLLCLPLTTYGITTILHGAMLDKYVLATVLGMALALSCIKPLPKAIAVIVFAFFGLLLCMHELLFWQSEGSLRPEDSATQVEIFVQKGGHPDLPVVVADALIYLPLEMYVSPESKGRFVYLVDEQKAIRFVRTDTVDKNLVLLRQYLRYAMPDFSEFARSHPEFLLYTENPKADVDWLSIYLPLAAKSMELVNRDAKQQLYIVRMNGPRQE